MEKLCWNIWMNPKSNYKGPLKREAQREIWHLQNRRRQWNQEGEIRETQPQSRNAGSYRKTEEARISFSSRASGGSTARPTPWSGSVRLISHFRFPEAWENELRLFLATSCGDLLQQPQEINTLTNYKLFQSGCWNRHCPGPKRVSCESSPPFQMALSLLRGFIHVPVLHSTLWTLLGDPPQLSRLLCLSCSLSLCYSVLRTRTCLVFPDSWFRLLHLGSWSDCFRAFSLCRVLETIKHCRWALPLLPASQGLLPFTAWCPGSWKLWFQVFVCFFWVALGGRVDLVPIIPSWLETLLMFVGILFFFD